MAILSRGSPSQAQAEAAAIAGQLASLSPKKACRGAKMEYLRELLIGDVRPMLALFAPCVIY